ncbi:FISUMP domain-containing protein [uncultured Dysgonomonas sp.]|uniref:Fibrobacter succinogenes major paralogous domain-containing protein n=1 Tax=uncultured Dysgonomonas sp. TaxID=206096 RepID=A0A212JP78_9BACT|nr:FISUMP domain-containing protein [uncultured Dysgonomonas sp.]SBW01243.1 exported hypothetical protein [uncultured Dysgonomonas sp.]
MKKILTYGFMYLCMTAPSFVSAQVTIGSDKDPNLGALLDLKEDESTNIKTASRGLGLPRVTLTSLTLPDNETSLASTIERASGTWDPQTHTGLIVYHLGGELKHCSPINIKDGPYVWNGEKWDYLIQETKTGSGSNSYGVYEVYDDRDGDVYQAGNFGDAGDWLLENMRYIDDSFTAKGYVSSTPLTGRHYFYPEGDTSNPATIPLSWYKRKGIFYTWSAALMGEQDGIKVQQGQVNVAIGNNEVEVKYESASGKKDGKIQGVCPKGWHVPSDRDWNMLEKEMYNSPTKYSTYLDSDYGIPFGAQYTAAISGTSNGWISGWTDEWAINRNNVLVNNSPPSTIGGNTLRGSTTPGVGHGHAMISQCQLIESGFVGKSLPPEKGGFDALLLGGQVAITYGFRALFWTSSAGSSTSDATAYGRNIIVDTNAITNKRDQMVERWPSMRNYFMSVRCKKD